MLTKYYEERVITGRKIMNTNTRNFTWQSACSQLAELIEILLSFTMNFWWLNRHSLQRKWSGWIVGHSAESCGLFHLFQKFIDITRQNILVWWAMHGRVNAIDFRACIMLMMVFTMQHVRLQIQRKRYYSQFQVAKYLSLPWISKAIYA